MIFVDSNLDRAVDDIYRLIERRGLNNGQLLSLFTMLLVGNLAMQDAPPELTEALRDVVQTGDPRPFVRLCGVELARDLPPHWKLENSKSGSPEGAGRTAAPHHEP